MTRPMRYRRYLCRKCEKMTQHSHMHDSPYGLAGAHMAGTERFVCRECQTYTYAVEGAVAKQFPFKLDEVSS